MDHKDKKLDFDLDFLEKGTPEKSDKKVEKKGSDLEKPASAQPTVTDSAPMADSTKWILGGVGVAVVIILIALSSSGGSSATTTTTSGSTYPPITATTNSTPTPIPSSNTNASAPNTSDSQTTSDVAGCNAGDSYSETTGLSCSGDGSCQYQETYDKSAGECVTPLTYCQDQNGTNATYIASTNSCACVAGYQLNSNNICVIPETGYQVCADMNATWDGSSHTSSGGYSCTCDTGYETSSDGKSCVLAPVKTGYQVCSNSYPNATWDGTYTTAGKYNCVCDAGYSWNSTTQSCTI